VRSGVRSPTKNSQKGTNNKLRHCIKKIQKIDVKFYNHLKGSNSQTFHNKAIYRDMNLEKSPQSKLVLGLCSQKQTDSTEP
jgi:hypothetical protein